MTVGELRKVLEGVADEVPVAYNYDGYLMEANEAEIVPIRESVEQPRGFAVYSKDGKPCLVIG
jgi:hypothetical protein